MLFEFETHALYTEGLKLVIGAIGSGTNIIALANKESIVCNRKFLLMKAEGKKANR